MRLFFRAVSMAVVRLVLLVLAASLTFAQDSLEDLPSEEGLPAEEAVSEQSSEPVFTEIELSPEGVVAYDSLGNRWFYDFDENSFVLDPRAGRAGRRSGRREVAVEEHDPVDLRCTEQLKIPLPALKAVFVGYDEYVEGDILAYDRVTVKGWVRGDVQSVNKRVLVTSSGQVDGDIRAPDIEVREGGVVLGKQKLTEPGFPIPVDLLTSSFSTAGIWVVFGFTLALLLAAFLAASLMPRQVSLVTACIANHTAKTFLLGFLFTILMPVIVSLIAITIIGVIVVPLVPLAYLLALSMGMSASGRLIAKALVRYTKMGSQSQMFYSLTGILAYMILWTAVALLLGSGGPDPSVAGGIGIALLVISILATIWPLTTGVGAAVLTRFGFREYIGFRSRQRDDGAAAPAPAPPPLSDGPPTPPITGAPPSTPAGNTPEDLGHSSENR